LKFVTFHADNSTRLGVLDNDDVVDINAADPDFPLSLLDALEQGRDIAAAGTAALKSSAKRIPFKQLPTAPAIPRPRKIICLGLNYFDHAKEGGRDKPEYPWFFYRGSSSLIAHQQPALLPRISLQFDYEAELATVIASVVPRHVSREQALKYVFGYSCFNDLSVRDYQKRTPQWTIGKNFDGTGAFGPYIVTADELPPGGAGLRIQGRLNGVIMQDASTDDMIFNVAETIALLSECMTLEPGDVIVMGTPAGIGAARKPPVWLKENDLFEVDIERVGLLVNTVQKEDSPHVGRTTRV
jgi:acylpyruvate hydrolase